MNLTNKKTGTHNKRLMSICKRNGFDVERKRQGENLPAMETQKAKTTHAAKVDNSCGTLLPCKPGWCTRDGI